MDADPGNVYIETFRGGVQWCMIERKFDNKCQFIQKNENRKLVLSNGQSIVFRLSMEQT